SGGSGAPGDRRPRGRRRGGSRAREAGRAGGAESSPPPTAARGAKRRPRNGGSVAAPAEGCRQTAEAKPSAAAELVPAAAGITGAAFAVWRCPDDQHRAVADSPRAALEPTRDAPIRAVDPASRDA